VVDELRRPRDSTLPRLGIDAGGPAGKVERLALPGSGEVLLHVAVVPGGVNRVMLPLMAVELEEMVRPYRSYSSRATSIPPVFWLCATVQRKSPTFRSVVVLISASTSVRCEAHRTTRLITLPLISLCSSV